MPAPTLFETMCVSFGDGLAGESLRPSLRRDFERDWSAWMKRIFPDLKHFAPHHAWFWERVWQIEPGIRPVPTVSIWGRGGAKSSSAEMAAVALGAMGRRKYALYVSGTQPQADKHLDAIAALLESSTIERDYPALANRAVNKYGSSRGWRRNRMTTASGFVVDAVGLATGTRGVKFEDQRPDLIIIDDVDELHDTAEATEKKIHTLTHTLLPAGSTDLAVIAIQNVIIPDGIFARLSPDAEEPATFLADRDVSGPIPAVYDLEYEQDERGRVTITGGTASWDGQPLEVCQQQINDWGIDAFLGEAQHQPRLRGAKVFLREWWQGKARYDATDEMGLRRTFATGMRFIDWDTAETLGDGSAYSACTVGELHQRGDGYVLRIREVTRMKVTFPDLMQAIYAKAEEWNRDGQLREVAIENASSGRQAYQQLQAESKLYGQGIHVQPVPVTQSKELRAQGAAHWCRMGRVELPEDAPWLPLFLSELLTFPQSPQMDMTDSFTQMVNRWASWLAPQQTGNEHVAD
jgi:predicted phage terminase large subunit-like protein